MASHGQQLVWPYDGPNNDACCPNHKAQPNHYSTDEVILLSLVTDKPIIEGNYCQAGLCAIAVGSIHHGKIKPVR